MTIKLLPQDVINKLAAGEIIHSEVQVIKELVENSIDAGATRIEITINGSNSIVFKDNGNGISKDDLPLLCTRFATSKLDKYENLQQVQTMGFRGEALSSISYVGEILVETTHNKTNSKASYKDSQILQLTSNKVDCDNFTKFEIKLTSLEINYLNVQRFVQTFQLLNNDLEFILYNQGEAYILSPGTKQQRIEQYFNVQNSQLHKIELKKQNFNFEMYIALPSNKYTLIKQQIFINNRYIKDIALINSLNTILRTYLINKKFNFIVFLNVNPNSLDFNCHVQKLKVIFQNYENVINNIVEAVQKFKRDNSNIMNLNQKNDQQIAKINKLNRTQPLQQLNSSQLTLQQSSNTQLQQYTNQKSNLQYLRMSQLNSQIDYQIQQSQIRQQNQGFHGIKLYLQYLLQKNLLSKKKIFTFYEELQAYYKQNYIEYNKRNIKILNLATSKYLTYIFIQIELNLVQIKLDVILSIVAEHAVIINYLQMKSQFMFFDIDASQTQHNEEQIFLGFTQQTIFTLYYFLHEFGIKYKRKIEINDISIENHLNIVSTLQKLLYIYIINMDKYITNEQQLINQLDNYLNQNQEIICKILENGKIISQNQILTMFDRQ